MIIKKRNLFEECLKGELDVILLPYNCFHNSNNYTARKIREFFPFSVYVDKRTIKGDRKKLGGFSKCKVDLREVDFKINKKLLIVNAYLYYSDDDPKFEYKNIQSVFKLLKEKYTGKKIGLPFIGRGFKNICISKICKIIDFELKGEDYYMVIDGD